jgi:hypothetical protein
MVIVRHENIVEWGSPIPFPAGGACVLSVIRFQDQLWSVPKLGTHLTTKNPN